MFFMIDKNLESIAIRNYKPLNVDSFIPIVGFYKHSTNWMHTSRENWERLQPNTIREELLLNKKMWSTVPNLALLGVYNGIIISCAVTIAEVLYYTLNN